MVGSQCELVESKIAFTLIVTLTYVASLRRLLLLLWLPKDLVYL